MSIKGSPLTQGSPYPEPEFVPYRHPRGQELTVPETPPRTSAAVNSQKAAREARFARYTALRDGGAGKAGLTKEEAAAEMRLGRSTSGAYDREWRQQREGGERDG